MLFHSGPESSSREQRCEGARPDKGVSPQSMHSQKRDLTVHSPLHVGRAPTAHLPGLSSHRGLSWASIVGSMIAAPKSFYICQDPVLGRSPHTLPLGVERTAERQAAESLCFVHLSQSALPKHISDVCGALFASGCSQTPDPVPPQFSPGPRVSKGGTIRD
jgi:hypothetical protein